MEKSMSEWRNFHFYYTDIDCLVTECIYPVLREIEPALQNCFWERHYAGGAHVRVRLRGASDVLSQASALLVRQAHVYMEEHPSRPLPSYSEDHAAHLMRLENQTFEGADLVYRVNTICESPYQRLHHQLASDDAAALLEQFLQKAMPLTAAILLSDCDKMDEMLRLFFLHAILVSGNLPRGCVAYKSHWEGFGATFTNRGVVDRIRRRYHEQRERIQSLMLQIESSHGSGDFAGDPVLAGWNSIFVSLRPEVWDAVISGKKLTGQLENAEQVHQAWDYVTGKLVEDSPFLRMLFSDDRFLPLYRSEPRMVMPRVMTNLFYALVSCVGLNMIDRYALCFYSHRAAEEYFHCDLTNILEQTIANAIRSNAHLFQSTVTAEP
jgi:hypothetical protein